jgi:trehalose-6-phosphatase
MTQHWRNGLDKQVARLLNGRRFGLITDVDGTISRLVDEPDAATIVPRSRQALATLQTRAAAGSGRLWPGGG